jgi:hypothetical protein
MVTDGVAKGEQRVDMFFSPMHAGALHAALDDPCWLLITSTEEKILMIQRGYWERTYHQLYVDELSSQHTCLPCPLRPRCSKAKTGGRTLTIYPQEQYEALQRARERQKTEEFKVLYGERAGIEGTISQSVRKMGLRRSRYIGLSRTHLQHVATAAAINVVRVTNWLAGELPEATRVSPFQALATS